MSDKGAVNGQGSRRATGGLPDRLGVKEALATLNALAEAGRRGDKKAFDGLNLQKLFPDLAKVADVGEAGKAAQTEREPETPATRGAITPESARTQTVIDSLLVMKRHKRAKPSSIETYEKKLRQFEKSFSELPLDPEPIMGYLNQFSGATGRHRRNHHDLLGMLYEHATKRFGIPRNPMVLIERTIISTRPIRTLSLAQVGSLLRSPANLRDCAALELLVGHGWRQIEVRRALVRDVLAIDNDLIEIDGKERRELTPIVPATAAKSPARLPTVKWESSWRRLSLGPDGWKRSWPSSA